MFLTVDNSIYVHILNIPVLFIWLYSRQPWIHSKSQFDQKLREKRKNIKNRTRDNMHLHAFCTHRHTYFQNEKNKNKNRTFSKRGNKMNIMAQKSSWGKFTVMWLHAKKVKVPIIKISFHGDKCIAKCAPAFNILDQISLSACKNNPQNVHEK